MINIIIIPECYKGLMAQLVKLLHKLKYGKMPFIPVIRKSLSLLLALYDTIMKSLFLKN